MSEASTTESLELDELGSSESEASGTPDAPPAKECQGIQQRVVEMLKTVYDPEIPVDIYELGLIYEVEVRPENFVYVKMTLTTPMCPVAETLPPDVEMRVARVPGVAHAHVDITWEPPWDPTMMSEAAKLELGF